MKTKYQTIDKTIASLSGVKLGMTVGDSLAGLLGVPPKKPKRQPKLRRLVLDKFEAPASFIVGMVTVSEANVYCHWSKRSKRRKLQQASISLFANESQFGGLFERYREAIKQRVTVQVIMTRIAPGKLDDDNLASACKACRDQWAEILRVDDGSPLVEFSYHQQKSKLWGIRVTLTSRD